MKVRTKEHSKNYPFNQIFTTNSQFMGGQTVLSIWDHIGEPKSYVDLIVKYNHFLLFIEMYTYLLRKIQYKPRKDGIKSHEGFNKKLGGMIRELGRNDRI